MLWGGEKIQKKQKDTERKRGVKCAVLGKKESKGGSCIETYHSNEEEGETSRAKIENKKYEILWRKTK